MQVRGYSEDEVDLLVSDFEALIERSVIRAIDRAAADLRPAVVAAVAHSFHLPGKHDQSTHGRSRLRTIRVLDGVGGWQGSPDVDVRAANLWAESFDGQRAVVATMRNIHAGADDPTEGVTTTGGHLNAYARAEGYPSGERYGADAVRDDIFNAAVRLDDRLESPDPIAQPIYRGMRVTDAQSRFTVGTEFDSDVSSWTTHRSHAGHYTSPSAPGGRPANGTPVIMQITGGARGVNLDDGGLNIHAGTGEHLVRGSFRITGVSTEEVTVPGLFGMDPTTTTTLIVDVEQL